MNLPNKLTILRTIMIPVFLIFLYIPGLGMTGDVLAAAIFVLASFTDLLDGKIARKYNLVTNFGKFMDPLADKLLVCSALIALVDLNRIPAWVVIIIIAREFIISGFRLIASDNGVVIAASYWGKFKTTFQIIIRWKVPESQIRKISWHLRRKWQQPGKNFIHYMQTIVQTMQIMVFIKVLGKVFIRICLRMLMK